MALLFLDYLGMYYLLLMAWVTTKVHKARRSLWPRVFSQNHLPDTKHANQRANLGRGLAPGFVKLSTKALSAIFFLLKDCFLYRKCYNISVATVSGENVISKFLIIVPF